MASATVALDQPWIMVPLTYGFAARLVTGPRLSPLGQLATRVITPRLNFEHRLVPGPPKRLAQGMGFLMSATALVLYYGLSHKKAAYAVLGMLIFAAGLESAFGICLACRMFPTLVRLRLIPESVCAECGDLSLRTIEREPVESPQAQSA